MPVVSNTVKHPDGSLAAGVRVRIRLVASDPVGAPGFVGATDYTVISEAFVLTNDAGLWSATLAANSTIVPDGTVYEVVEDVRGKVTAYYVSVPSGAGPYWAGDILAVAPSTEAFALTSVRQGPESLWLYTGQASPWPRTIATGVDVQQDVRPASDGVLYDPLGMMQQSGTYVSATFGETWGAGSWFRLGLGIWMLSLAVKWDGNTAGDREASLGVMDDRQLATGIDAFWWAPNLVENIATAALRIPATTLSSGFQVSSSFMAVTPQMLASSDGQSAAGQGVAVGLNLFQNSGGGRQITYLTAGMVKLASNPISV